MKIFKIYWHQIWIEYQTINVRNLCVAIRKKLSQKRLQTHKSLIKFENNLIIQMRSKRIDLINYFFMRHVLIFVLSTCVCDWVKQIFKHILFFCSKHMNDKHAMCLESDSTNYRTLFFTKKNLRAITKWMMNINFLNQFLLIFECFFFISRDRNHKI